MKIIKKINQKNGSSMILAVVAMSILSISSFTLLNMVNNQLKTTKNTYDDVVHKYEAESGIEKSIASVNTQIMNNINSSETYSNDSSYSIDSIKNRLIRANAKTTLAYNLDIPNDVKNEIKGIENRIQDIINNISLENSNGYIEDIKEIQYDIMILVNKRIDKEYGKQLNEYMIYNLDNTQSSALDELEIAVDNIKIYEHIDCDIKVEYKENGVPKESSYQSLIWSEFVQVVDTYTNYMSEYYTYFSQYVENGNNLGKLRNEYANYRNKVNSNIGNVNGMNKNQFNELLKGLIGIHEMTNSINKEVYSYFTKNLNKYGNHASNETLKNIITASYELEYDKTYEILCRLGKLETPEVPEIENPDIPGDKNQIKIYDYSVSVKDDNLRIEEADEQIKEIDVTRASGVVTDVDLSNLKDLEIQSILYENEEPTYKITAKVDFNINIDTSKPINERYNLTYEIKGYDKQPL